MAVLEEYGKGRSRGQSEEPGKEQRRVSGEESGGFTVCSRKRGKDARCVFGVSSVFKKKSCAIQAETWDLLRVSV